MPKHPYVGELNRKIRGLVDSARRKARAGDNKGASSDLRKAAKLLRDLSGYASALEEQIHLVQKAKRFEAMAADVLQGKKVLDAAKDPDKESVPAGDEYRASVDELEYRSAVTWDDIGGMEHAKQTLKYVLGTMLARHPGGVSLGIGRRLLLYGPPGTGKTQLAAACSNMLNAPFFNVKASDLLSKYFGESTKLISALFARARERAVGGAAVIFIDEADSLSLDRDDNPTGAEVRIVSTLLAELDGMSEKSGSESVITIVATNKPWAMDEAILQRFHKHVYVGLPDNKAREAIFQVCIDRRGLTLDEGATCEKLAHETECFSGRLIANVCNEAVERMVKEMNAEIPGRVDDGTIGDYQLRYRPLTWADFKEGLTAVRPTISPEALKSYDTWAAKVGGHVA